MLNPSFEYHMISGFVVVDPLIFAYFSWRLAILAVVAWSCLARGAKHRPFSSQFNMFLD
jgi:hypothetical protein